MNNRSEFDARGHLALYQDPVNHPAHYNQIEGIECIDVIENFCFNIGAAIKHLWRAGHKGDIIEDLRKAQWYLNREIERHSHEE